MAQVQNRYNMLRKKGANSVYLALRSIEKILCALGLIMVLFPVSLHAMVSGDSCSNCHTMHNSQNNTAMQILGPGESDTGPKPSLLKGTCLGCHSSISADVSVDPVTGAPIVFNTVEPSYGTKGLAAGNFYWVQTEDTKGHNIFASNPDDILSQAPGNAGAGIYCGTNSCHVNLDRPVSGVTNFDGRQSCTKCHMVSEVSNPPGYSQPKGFHHANDGTGTKLVDTAAKGWYRFLSGHISGSTHGVTGIEDDDRELETNTDHNEYLGIPRVSNDDGGFVNCGDTMTGYCTGCHGDFHNQDDSSGDNQSPWVRHPSDLVLPTSGEYTAYTSYDPLVPVARPQSFINNGISSNTVTPGQDMVMCLSCHRAHGSEFFKIMRWDYRGWPASGTNGCNICHTSKS